MGRIHRLRTQLIVVMVQRIQRIENLPRSGGWTCGFLCSNKFHDAGWPGHGIDVRRAAPAALCGTRRPTVAQFQAVDDGWRHSRVASADVVAFHETSSAGQVAAGTDGLQFVSGVGGRGARRSRRNGRQTRIGRRVRLDVRLQRLLGTVRLAAERALVQALARVDPHVPVQLAAVLESASAVGASVRFLFGVDPPVDAQVLFDRKRFAAKFADERPLARVRPVVARQTGRNGERFAANVAPVRLFRCHAGRFESGISGRRRRPVGR